MDAYESEHAGTTTPERVTMSYRPGSRRGVDEPDELDTNVLAVQATGTSVVQDSYYPLPRPRRTVYCGHEHVLRQTVIALAAGQQVDEHENPGETTILVLHGRVRLRSGDDVWDGSHGDLLIVPDARHSLEAVEDAAVLLTVAKLR